MSAAEHPPMPLPRRMTAAAQLLAQILPRWALGRLSLFRLLHSAGIAAKAGLPRLERWCWTRVVRVSGMEEQLLLRLARQGLERGEQQLICGIVEREQKLFGLSPTAAMNLAGLFVGAGAAAEARTILLQLRDRLGAEVLDQFWSPYAVTPKSLDALCDALCPTGLTESALDESGWLAVARACFSAAAYEGAVASYALASERSLEDELALAYSSIRVGKAYAFPGQIGQVLEELPEPWWGAAATAAFAGGELDAVAELVERWTADEEQKARVRRTLTLLSGTAAGAAEAGQVLPEAGGDGPVALLLCGFGWTGSGAVYDALLDAEPALEPLETEADPWLNDDTETELTFVQGLYGLGQIWRRHQSGREVDRLYLWNFIRCHVLGWGVTGYAERKSARGAELLVGKLGMAYVEACCEFAESFLSLAPDADPLPIFQRMTAAVLRAVAAGQDRVLLNNAVFGQNADMLAVFPRARAAIVSRDPADQLADRRRHDLKHWMSAERFRWFYASGQAAFLAGREKLHPAVDVRAVPFERFVLEPEFRAGTLAWLLGRDQQAAVSAVRFDPALSARNIGIGTTDLSADELRLFETAPGG